MNGKRGFTLIELLLVLAVFVFLLAMITPVALKAVEKAKATQVATNLRNIASTLQSYYFINGEMPESVKKLIKEGYIAGRDEDYDLFDITQSTPTNDSTVVYVVYAGDDVNLEYIQKEIWISVIDYKGTKRPALEVRF